MRLFNKRPEVRIGEENETLPSTPPAYTENPKSFGPDFNLLLAIKQYGPERVKQIDIETAELRDRLDKLVGEKADYLRVISALTPV